MERKIGRKSEREKSYVYKKFIDLQTWSFYDEILKIKKIILFTQCVSFFNLCEIFILCFCCEIG